MAVFLRGHGLRETRAAGRRPWWPSGGDRLDFTDYCDARPVGAHRRQTLDGGVGDKITLPLVSVCSPHVRRCATGLGAADSGNRWHDGQAGVDRGFHRIFDQCASASTTFRVAAAICGRELAPRRRNSMRCETSPPRFESLPLIDQLGDEARRRSPEGTGAWCST